MESQLVWKEEYNIGVDIIDKEHKQTFRIWGRRKEESMGMSGGNQIF